MGASTPVKHVTEEEYLHNPEFEHCEYVDGLVSALDMDAIRAAQLRLGADALGGAGVAYWGEIATRHRHDVAHRLVELDLVDPCLGQRMRQARPGTGRCCSPSPTG